MDTLGSLSVFLRFIRGLFGPSDILVFERINQATIEELAQDSARVRVWSRGEAAPATLLKDLAPIVRASAKKVVACSVFFDDATVADRKLPDGFHYLGETLCSYRKGVLKIYLSRGVLTAAYAPREFISVTLSNDHVTALAQAKSLLRLIKVQSLPKNRCVYLYADSEDKISSQLYQFMVAEFGSLQPLQLGRRSLLRGIALPDDLRRSLVVLMGSLLIYGVLELARAFQTPKHQVSYVQSVEQNKQVKFSGTAMGSVISYIDKLIESEGLSNRLSPKLRQINVRLGDDQQYTIDFVFSSDRKGIAIGERSQDFVESRKVGLAALGLSGGNGHKYVLSNASHEGRFSSIMLESAQKHGFVLVIYPSESSGRLGFEIRPQPLTNIIAWLADLSRHDEFLLWDSLVLSRDPSAGSISVRGELRLVGSLKQ